MNTGAFGEGFPYSNYHDLNMDWIIKVAKDFLDQYTTIQQIISDGTDSLNTTIADGIEDLEEKKTELENLLDTWYDTHSEDIANQLANALADLNAWYTLHSGYLDQYLSTSISAFNSAAELKASQTIATIPDDYTTLSNNVTTLQYKMASVLSGAASTHWEVGSYSPTSGNVYEHSNLSRCTDLVGYKDGYCYVESTSKMRVFAYQQDGTFVGIYKLDGTFSTGTTNEADAYKFIFSDFPNYMFHIVIKTESTTEQQNTIFYVEKIYNKIKSLSDEVYGSETTDVTGTTSNGVVYNNTSGKTSTSIANGQATGFIEIQRQYEYYYSGGTYNWAGGVCFYDADKKFISAFVPLGGTDILVTSIPNGAWYMTASTNNRNNIAVKLEAKEKAIRTIADQNTTDINILKNQPKINHIYVATTGDDTDGDGSSMNPYASIYHANETITDNSADNQYIIHVADGTYTDLQTRFAGSTPSSYEGIGTKNYVTYEGNVSNPAACKIVWDGVTGYDPLTYTYDDTAIYKCIFHVTTGHVVIRGFTLEATNVRYALHIECSGYGMGFDWLISDCNFIWHGTPGCIDRDSSPSAIGTGSGNFEHGHLLRCTITNDSGINSGYKNHDSSNRYPNAAFIEGANIIIESCNFAGGGSNTTVVFRNIHSDNVVEGYDRFSILNCIGISTLGYELSGEATVCNWRAEVKCSQITNNRYAAEGLLQ